MNTTNRRGWMSLLATASSQALAEGLSDLGALPSYDMLRRPEIGGVMVRGRMGGTGGQFNLGEMTVTRCSLRLESGVVGHAYVQGRNRDHAERAALVDALMQTAQADEVRVKVLAPLSESRSAERATRARKAAATKVDFFTMVRGEG